MSSTRPAAKTRTLTAAGDESGGDHNSVVLGPRDRLIGSLRIEGDLRVAGTVEGALEATGSIEIGEGGRVSGPVTAHNRLVVGKDAFLFGDVRVARLVVEDGATFSGKVSMGKPVEAHVPDLAPSEPEPARAPEAKPRRR